MSRDQIYDDTIRYFFAPVADLLYKDESVTEVLINGHKEIYCERNETLERVNCEFPDEHNLLAAVRNLAEYVGKTFDETTPSMDARLPGLEKFRVHVIQPPASRNGICVSIRKFKKSNTTLDWLMEKGSLSPQAADYLKYVVQGHKNVVISGGTGSGKTSLLNALSTVIDERERIVVIEDSSELRLNQQHVVYLEARPAQSNGAAAITIRDLFVDSLRMRPDRILVGEVRRGEALDLIQSMLSGHDGTLTTVHASTPEAALVRLETLCLMNEVGLPVTVARSQVGTAVHVVVQTARIPNVGRRVTGIAEISGRRVASDFQYRVRHLFEMRPQSDGSRKLVPTGKTSRYGWKYQADTDVVTIEGR